MADIGRKGQKVMRSKHPSMAAQWGRMGGRPRKPDLAGAGECRKKEVGGEAGHPPPPQPPE
ncbi:MAG: hypothetical protein ABIG98_02345 [Chloroflexota bacterium]